MRCVECGKEMKVKVVEQGMQLGKHLFVGDVEALVCPCGEREIHIGEVAALEKAIASHLAKNGPISKETFRFMRKFVGTGVEVAKLLAVAPETISRWEGGGREVDRSAWTLVGSLVLEKIAGRNDTRARMLKVGQKAESAVHVERLVRARRTG